MSVVVRLATPAERDAGWTKPRPDPCAEGAALRVGLSSKPVNTLPVAIRATQRARGRRWRDHFLSCPSCYDVWVRESLDHGGVVLAPPRPLPSRG